MGQLQNNSNLRQLKEINSYSIEKGKLTISTRTVKKRTITSEEIQAAKEEFFLRNFELAFA